MKSKWEKYLSDEEIPDTEDDCSQWSAPLEVEFPWSIDYSSAENSEVGSIRTMEVDLLPMSGDLKGHDSHYQHACRRSIYRRPSRLLIHHRPPPYGHPPLLPPVREMTPSPKSMTTVVESEVIGGGAGSHLCGSVDTSPTPYVEDSTT